MYSVVLMAAVSIAPASTNGFWFGHGCHGRWGGGCAGCSGCYGCGGCSGCGGCYGCGGGCYGCGGCHGCAGGGGWHGGAGSGYGHGPIHGGWAWYTSLGCYGCYGSVGSYPTYGTSGEYHSWPVYAPGAAGGFGCNGCYGCYGGWSGYGSALPGHMNFKDAAPDAKVPPRPGIEETPLPKEKSLEEARAKVSIEVPEGGKLYIDNKLMKGKTGTRVFQTPGLKPGAVYYYEVKVEIERGGQTVAETQRVILHPSQMARVAFPDLQKQRVDTAQNGR